MNKKEIPGEVIINYIHDSMFVSVEESERKGVLMYQGYHVSDIEKAIDEKNAAMEVENDEKIERINEIIKEEIEKLENCYILTEKELTDLLRIKHERNFELELEKYTKWVG